jgi:general secretion pathway protein I
MSDHKAPEAAGFTLIEVIVAMTILAIGFSAVFAGMSQSAANIRKLEKVQRREMFTRNLLAQLDLVHALKLGDTATGSFDDGTRWRLEVQPFIPPSLQNANSVVRVELRMEWEGSAGPQNKTIETYRVVKPLPPDAPGLEGQLHVLQ